jgi:hypothetical protein
MDSLQESSLPASVLVEESFLTDASRIVRRCSIGGRLEVTRISFVPSFLSTYRSNRYKGVLLYTHGVYLSWPAGPVSSSDRESEWLNSLFLIGVVKMVLVTTTSTLGIQLALLEPEYREQLCLSDCRGLYVGGRIMRRKRKVRRKLRLEHRYVLRWGVALSPSHLTYPVRFLNIGKNLKQFKPSSSKPSST